MPFEAVNDDLMTLRTPLAPEPEPAPRSIPLQESVIGPAARQANMVASIMSATAYPGMGGQDEDHNPLDVIKGTVYEQDYLDDFVGSSSEAETRARMAQIDRELKDKQRIEEAGWSGTIAMLATGAIDPTVFIPAGNFVRSARMGEAFLKNALKSGAIASGAAGISELGMQSSQLTRSSEESLLNVGAATILAGLLGSAAAPFATRAERVAGEKALKSIRNELKSTTGITSASAAATDTRMLEPTAMLPEAITRGYQATRDLLERGGDIPMVGKVTGPIGKGLSKVLAVPEALIKRSGPLGRMAWSDSIAGKRAAFDLVESPIEFRDNALGIPTSARGPAVETVARIAVDGARYKLGQELDRLFKEYFFGRDVRLGKTRAFVAGLRGQTEGRMGYREFKAAIADALMNNDTHQIKAVEDAAKFIRKEIFDPWKEAAIRAKLLPEDVSVDTAKSYFTRLYDKEKIIARRPEATGIVRDWLAEDQTAKARIKDELQDNRDLRADRLRLLRRMDRRLETIDKRQSDLESRLSEREVETTRTGNRVDALKERTDALNDQIADLEEFIGDARQAVRDPALKAEIAQLQNELAELKKADKPITEADLARMDKEEANAILTGPTRKAARIAIGKAKPPKIPSLAAWIAREGGIKDVGGNVLHAIGEKEAMPGLISAKGHDLDWWGERLKQDFPEAFLERPDPDTVLDFISASVRGEQPQWFIEGKVKSSDLEAMETAAIIERLADEANVDLRTMDDVVDLFRAEDARTLDDLEREAAGMPDAAVSLRRADTQDQIRVRRETIANLRDDIARARELKAPLAVKEGKEGARLSEAELNRRANASRIKALSKRSERLDLQQDILARIRETIESDLDALRLKAEENIKAWEGKSAADAQSALKAREKQEADRQARIAAGEYEGKGQRLTGADKAVDRAIKRIIRSDRDKSLQELESLADEIIERILGSPDGRLPYDAPSGGPTVGAPREGPPPRGPLAARSFMIPDERIKDFLVRDVEQVAHSYLGTIVPDVLLTERFGDVDMTQAFRQINEEFAAKFKAAGSEKERMALRREQERVIADLAAMRDRLRGTYGYTSDSVMKNAGRIAGALGSINTLADMGGSAISQITDFAGPVFRYGALSALKGAYLPFIRGLSQKGEGAFSKAAAQYRAIGIGVDMWHNTRNLDEVGEQYHPRTRGERALRGAAQGFMVANLSAPATDAAKSVAAVTIGNEVLKAAKAVAEGKATAKQIKNLGASSIDPDMATRIWESFQSGGAIEDGVYLPNTADWSDTAARLHFEAAVSREANIAVVTPGQEKALWLSNPVLKIFGQFKAFIAASSIRILAANLQRRDAQALQGVVASIALGMVGYKAYSMVTGQETSARPQDWVKEGVSRSGVLGWLDEGNAFASKFTRGRLDLYRAIGADRPLSRYASRGVLGQLLGPTAGKIENLAQAVGAAASQEFTASDTRAARRLLPLQNLFYIRRLLNEVEDGFNKRLGIQAHAA